MSRKLSMRRLLLAAPLILGLVFVSFLIPFHSSAQVTSCPGNILKNGDFTSFTATGNGNFPNPSTVANWSPSSGNPRVVANPGCGDPGFISMWGNKAVGESVSQTGLSIQAGHTYRFSACVKWPNNNPQLHQYVRLKVRASNGLPSYTATGPTAPSVGIIGYPISTPFIPDPGITSTSWMKVTLGDWTATANFDTITLNPENDSSLNNPNEVSWIHVDNACLVEVFPPDFEATIARVGQPTTFTTATAGPWNWDFGDGAKSTQQNPSHTYTSPDLQFVALCTGINPACIYKLLPDTPGPPKLVITGPTNSCGNRFATYSVPAVRGASYSWSLTNGIIDIPASITGPETNRTHVIWDSNSSGTLSVTVTDKAHSSFTATLDVTGCDLHLGESSNQFQPDTLLTGLVHLGNGLYNSTSELWINQRSITRVTAEIISSSITYFPSQCGTSGPTSGYVTGAGNLTGFTPVVPVYKGHEALWYGPGVPLTGQWFPMQIKFPPPPRGKCRDELTFCLKYTFTDKDGKICEVIRCIWPITRGGPGKIPEEIL